ncbi:MAG: TusE/DsrC/DsvC family sulfur relay protein [Geothrix sp.]|uniref:TusE/DsrC/DsvC family sulfur relay protein n=1 Tax=Geothrix sp. TaxID=1962974 RepID=UPI00181279CC|nr:TusE/DsrC/DsvC family sulfur relay protein [Geothrix sp.]NWJ41343.1 TusE/DsrC/DsvC family sulfur relay protein [Geothrix sp.]WIL20670.1 MAG: TusE/DsrC/DsvC family sulfur relay protein [Geothrix sp.]
MSGLVFNGQMVALNEEGFLEDPSLWNEDLARALAQSEEGLDALGDEHWAVIRFIRSHFEEKQGAPMVRAVCKGTGLRLQQIYDLFPSGPAKGACKLAGLPKPDGCV